MSHPWPFTFEGQFLGFVADESGKFKYLNIGLPEADVVKIRLPKSLRSSLRLILNPGDAIRVRGLGKVELRTGELKLKADHILPLSTSTITSCLQGIDTIPNSLSSTPCSSRKPKAKILVCRKSGCLKRGGRELRQSLEKALCDRNWQDQVELEWTGCLKRCSKAPNFMILPGKKCHNTVHPSVLTQIDGLMVKKTWDSCEQSSYQASSKSDGDARS
jgi:hypothetical protein